MPTSEYYNEDYYKGRTSDYRPDMMEWEKVRLAAFMFVSDIQNKLGFPKTILELGCGPGFYVRAFREMGFEAEGVDISEYAVKHAHTKNIICGDIAKKLPFDHSFELILMQDVIEHIEEDKLKGLFENIRKLGSKFVYLLVPCRIDDGLEKGREKPMDKSHVTVLPLHEWVRKFKEIGFDLSFCCRKTIDEYEMVFEVKKK